MDLSLNEQQQMLKQGVEEFIAREATRDVLVDLATSEEGYSEAMWRSAAGIGWLGMATPEQYGGSATDLTDIAVVFEALGYAPVPGPLSLDPASQVAIVTFDQGSAKLTSRARRIIREVAEMQRQRGGRLHIVGHSSSWTRDMNLVRHNMINFGLSLDRANVVARELLQLGITGHDLTIGALSDSRPLFFEVMPSGEAGNRRVELYLDGG